MLADTHAHLHHHGLLDQVDQALQRAKVAKVGLIINVGVNADDSQQAVELAQGRAGVYAAVGLHPHEAQARADDLAQIKSLATQDKVVAIGECGLDYYKNYSPAADQERAFRAQIEIALEFNLPMLWHVREAFADFFRITDEYQGLRGIVHCFTSGRAHMEQAVARGYLLAFNGIMTFTRDQSQLEAAKHCPLDNMVLETDCPFLAPAAKRGSVNEPANVRLVAEFLAELRGESISDLAAATTANAHRLFGLETS